MDLDNLLDTAEEYQEESETVIDTLSIAGLNTQFSATRSIQDERKKQIAEHNLKFLARLQHPDYLAQISSTNKPELGDTIPTYPIEDINEAIDDMRSYPIEELIAEQLELDDQPDSTNEALNYSLKHAKTLKRLQEDVCYYYMRLNCSPRSVTRLKNVTLTVEDLDQRLDFIAQHETSRKKELAEEKANQRIPSHIKLAWSHLEKEIQHTIAFDEWSAANPNKLKELLEHPTLKMLLEEQYQQIKTDPSSSDHPVLKDDAYINRELAFRRWRKKDLGSWFLERPSQIFDVQTCTLFKTLVEKTVCRAYLLTEEHCHVFSGNDWQKYLMSSKLDARLAAYLDNSPADLEFTRKLLLLDQLRADNPINWLKFLEQEISLEMLDYCPPRIQQDISRSLDIAGTQNFYLTVKDRGERYWVAEVEELEELHRTIAQKQIQKQIDAKKKNIDSDQVDTTKPTYYTAHKDAFKRSFKVSIDSEGILSSKDKNILSSNDIRLLGIVDTGHQGIQGVGDHLSSIYSTVDDVEADKLREIDIQHNRELGNIDTSQLMTMFLTPQLFSDHPMLVDSLDPELSEKRYEQYDEYLFVYHHDKNRGIIIQNIGRLLKIEPTEKEES